MKTYQPDGEYGKTKIYRRKGKDYHKQLKAQEEGKEAHPVHTPYKKENKGNLRTSLIIDGLSDSE